ncbi:MAG: C4-dicarboxylate ABC transporter permease, partial [Deltaproteobacteria bacterium]|nr:C4-dicarboxylate ABC transporter permease [Deltaproteobacteria bacterium]
MDNSFIIGLEGLGVLVLLIAFRVPIAYSMLVVGIGGVAILSGPAIILSQLKD